MQRTRCEGSGFGIDHRDLMVLTLSEAAEQLRISPTTLRQMARHGRIRCAQDGKWGRYKFRQEWLDEYLDSHTLPLRENEKATEQRPARKRKVTPDPKRPELANWYA